MHCQVAEISEECTQLGIDQLVGDGWLEEDSGETGAVEMTDEEITDFVQENGGSENEEDEEGNVPSTVSHSESEAAFSACRTSLEQQAEATPMNLVLLQELHSLACNRKFKSLKQKKK